MSPSTNWDLELSQHVEKNVSNVINGEKFCPKSKVFSKEEKQILEYRLNFFGF